MDITFLGTGTSQGVPIIGCKCSVCQSKDPHDKRLRSAVFVHYKNTNLLIDAGPDFRQQMLSAQIEQLDGILITHSHYDHIGGLEDIRSFNYMQQKPIDIYGQDIVLKDIRKKYDYAFAENPYPGVPEMTLHEVGKEPFFTINNITIQPIHVLHLNLPILGYRIDNFAYITDANCIADEELQKLKNLDVLIINSLRRTKHLSHYCLPETLEVIDMLKPKQTYLTHLSHDMGLHQEVEKELPHNVHLGYDGLQIHL